MGGKIISIGGKAILLEVVAQAIPFFVMTVFSIPKGICKEITNIISYS